MRPPPWRMQGPLLWCTGTCINWESDLPILDACRMPVACRYGRGHDACLMQVPLPVWVTPQCRTHSLSLQLLPSSIQRPRQLVDIDGRSRPLEPDVGGRLEMTGENEPCARLL